MRITGLDIASRKTGWASGDSRETPQASAWLFPQVGDDLGQLGDEFMRVFIPHLEEFRPEAVVFEAPILVVNDRRRGTDKPLTLRKLMGLSFLMETICTRKGILCKEVGLQRIKSELTGNGFAAKDDMVAVARKVGLILPATKEAGMEDAADAFGAWVCGVREWDKAASSEWDRRIWSTRGGLL